MSRILDIEKVFVKALNETEAHKNLFSIWIDYVLENDILFQCRFCEDYFENEHDLDQYGNCKDCQEEKENEIYGSYKHSDYESGKGE